MKRISALFLVFALMLFAVPSAFAYEKDVRDVPQIRIVTKNGNGNTLLKSDGYTEASISVTDTNGSVLENDVLLKVRGNSTALDWVTKKSFTFKFDKKTDVLHMGSAKKWALLANCFDPTLIRNYIGLHTAKELSLPYTSEQRIVEVWIDNEYRGMYTLTEPIGDSKTRVDIDTDNGDFIVEYEATRSEDDVSYMTIDGLRFAAKEPSEPDAAQYAHIREAMTDIIAVLKSGVKSAIEQKIDVDSFVKYYLLNEYLKTVDFGFSSVFFFYKNGILYAGPPWDYDLSMGNSNPDYSSNAKNAYVTNGLFANQKNLYAILCRYDWFNYKAKKDYEAYHEIFENIYPKGGLIDTLLEDYGGVIERNYTEAGWSPSRYWVNVQKKPLSTYAENLSYLKNWCEERDIWLTEYFASQEYYLRGDSDGDEKVTVLDATNIQKILANLITNVDDSTFLRSKTSNEQLSILDATAIQKYLANLSNPNRIDEAVKITE